MTQIIKTWGVHMCTLFFCVEMTITQQNTCLKKLIVKCYNGVEVLFNSLTNKTQTENLDFTCQLQLFNLLSVVLFTVKHNILL